MNKWQPMSNLFGGKKVYQIWRQIRELEQGEPTMFAGVRETKGLFETLEAAEAAAAEANLENITAEKYFSWTEDTPSPIAVIPEEYFQTILNGHRTQAAERGLAILDLEEFLRNKFEVY